MEAETPSSAWPLDCDCIGSFHRALVQSRGKLGSVINVFERTVNIRTNNDELLVVTLDRTRSPVNLNVSAGLTRQGGFSGLVRHGQTAAINGAGTGPLVMFQVGSIAVSIDAPDVFQSLLQMTKPSALHSFTAAVDRIFSFLAAEAEKRAGCLLNPDMTTEGLLSKFLGQLASPEASNHQELVNALAGLCGRGPGFTPAGDDFIAGYLAVSNWLGSAMKLGPAIIPGEEFARLTTWTSFKLMEYSARGLLDDQAQLLLNSVTGGSVDDYLRCAWLVGRRGHTSGLDFATGATIGLYAVSDRVLGTEALERISGALDSLRPAQLS
jgi:hypothetical protein